MFRNTTKYAIPARGADIARKRKDTNIVLSLKAFAYASVEKPYLDSNQEAPARMRHCEMGYHLNRSTKTLRGFTFRFDSNKHILYVTMKKEVKLKIIDMILHQ